MIQKEKVEKVMSELEKCNIIQGGIKGLWFETGVYVTISKDKVDYLYAIAARYGVKVEDIEVDDFYRLCY